MKVYVIGSLGNPYILEVGNALRANGFEAFDDWFAAGPLADSHWQNYEHERGRFFSSALWGAHASDVFEFDKRNLDDSDAGVLVLPAGKSAHLEAGYLRGQDKPVLICMNEEPDRFDIMYRFAGYVGTLEGVINRLKLRRAAMGVQ